MANILKQTKAYIAERQKVRDNELLHLLHARLSHLEKKLVETEEGLHRIDNMRYNLFCEKLILTAAIGEVKEALNEWAHNG